MLIVTVLLNILLFVFGLFVAFQELVQEHPDLYTFFVCVLIIATPIMNIVFVAKVEKTTSWLALYLKRKRLEEKKKIATLTDKPETEEQGE